MAIEIKIGASFNDRDIRRAQAELNNLAKVTERAGMSMVQRMESTGQSMQRFGQSMMTNVSLPLVAVGAMSVKAFMDQEDAIARMESSLQSTGGVAGVTSQHIKDLASRLQETTTFADEVTVGGAALLLTFKNVRNEMGAGNDVFDRTIVAAQDLSAKLGTDLNGSVMLLGKALQDPERGLTRLTRAGVQFTDQQQQQIRALARSGDVLGAQKIMLQELESQFGGTAAAMANTTSGQLKQALNQLGEAGEAVGAALAPAIERVAGALSWLGTSLAGLPGPVQGVVVALGAIVAAAGPVIWATGSVMTNLAALAKTKIGVAIVDQLASWKGAISSAAAESGGLVNALRSRLSPALLAVGGVVAAAAAGFALLVNRIGEAHKEAARARFATVASDLESVSIAVANLGQTGQFTGALGNVSELSQAFTDLQSEATRVAQPGGVGAQLEEWFSDTDENAQAAEATLQLYNDALRNLLAVDADAATRAFEALSASLQANGVSAEEVTQRFGPFLEALNASNTLTPEARATLADMGITFDETGQAIGDATDALKEWEDSVRAQFDPLFAYGDSLDNVAEAQQRQQEAALTAMAAVATHGEGSTEAQAAIAAYQAAIRDTTSATLDASFQLEQLKEGLRTGTIDFDTASAHLDGLVASGLMTEEQARLTKDEWARLGWTVVQTPSTKDITITSNVGTVLDQMRELLGILNGITDTVIDRVQRAAKAAAFNQNQADGGPVFAGRVGWVGERGPELFIPKVDGTIVPHYQSRRIMDELGRGEGKQPQVVPVRGDVNVYVNKTNADPYEIGRELLWTMKVAG